MGNKQLSLMKQSTGFYQIAAQDLDEEDLLSVIVSLTLATEETTGTPVHTILGSAFQAISNYKRSNNQEFENKTVGLSKRKQEQLSFDSLYQPSGGTEETVKDVLEDRGSSVFPKLRATEPLKQKKQLFSLYGIDLSWFGKKRNRKKEEENFGIFQILGIGEPSFVNTSKNSEIKDSGNKNDVRK